MSRHDVHAMSVGTVGYQGFAKVVRMTPKTLVFQRIRHNSVDIGSSALSSHDRLIPMPNDVHGDGFYIEKCKQ
jgi:hypothetical protein